MRIKASVAILWVICACTHLSNAQEGLGTIIGQIVDSSGAVIPGASVTVTNVESGVKQATVSNGEGAYEFLYPLPGKHTVTASARGFKTTVEGVQVLIHERIKADFSLEVGAVAKEVKVSAEATQLQAANANLGQAVDGRRVAGLPLHEGTPY